MPDGLGGVTVVGARLDARVGVGWVGGFAELTAGGQPGLLGLPGLPGQPGNAGGVGVAAGGGDAMPE